LKYRPMTVSLWAERLLFHPRIRRVHEGWNEDGHPSVYRQTGDFNADTLNTGANCAFSTSPLCLCVSARRQALPLLQGEGRRGRMYNRAYMSTQERIFGLCKIWSILTYFFPYFETLRIDPDDALNEAISRAAATDRIQDYYGILETCAAALHDSHARVKHPALEASGCLPIRFRQVGDTIVVSAVAANALPIGAEVLAINGRALPELRIQWQARISASSPQAFMRDFLWRLRQGPIGENAEITIYHGAGTRIVTFMYAGAETQPSSEAGRASRFSGHAWLRGSAYIRKLGNSMVVMRPFDMPDVQTLRSAFRLIADTQGLVLDLRGYPNTHFQHELVRCLCREPVISPRYEIPVVSEPDLSRRTWKLVQHTLEPDGRPVYAKPAAALIDETTQSSAEDFCMYLDNARRVTFVGRPTAGCVGNLTFIALPGGGRMTFTGMRVTWPDGSPIWGIGIQPRVVVEPTLEGLKVGRDEVLETGIETLKELIAGNMNYDQCSSHC